MISNTDVASLIGAQVLDRDERKIGTIGQVYIDPDSGRPLWASVRTGLFGTRESFVPLETATEVSGDVRVEFDKDFVKDAPQIDIDGALEQDQQDELYRYYGLTGHAGSGSDIDYSGDMGTRDIDAGTTGYDTSGPNTDSAMTRSEEQLRVGTERVETGRARLRKYVVTEQQTVNVPVSREEVRLEREPITDANVGAAMSGPEISEEEHEVVLSEERVVVDKETVPVERVRLDTDTVTDTERVDAEVRKEQIELDEDGPTRRGDMDR